MSAPNVNFKFDGSELNEALKKMALVSDKEPAEIVNKKSFFIFRDAAANMKAVSQEEIKTELEASSAHQLVRLKSGKYSRAKKHIATFFGGSEFPLLAAIVQARARKSGKPSPWSGVTRSEGANRMLDAMRTTYAARQKSRGYFQKGFVGLRYLFRKSWSKATGAAGSIGGVNRLANIADGVPAHSGSAKAVATFFMVSPKHDLKDALDKYASPVLQNAFDKEAGETSRAADEKQFADAIRAVGIKVT